MKIRSVETEPPIMRKMTSGDKWEYVASWRCVIRTKKDGDLVARISPGYKTDLASVPKALRGAFDNGSGDFGVLVASQVHDLLYSTHYLSRTFADDLFYKLLRYFGVGCFKSFLYYKAVDLFGDGPWNKPEMELDRDRQLCRIDWVDRA